MNELSYDDVVFEMREHAWLQYWLLLFCLAFDIIQLFIPTRQIFINNIFFFPLLSVFIQQDFLKRWDCV